MTSQPKIRVFMVSMPGLVAQATRATVASIGGVALVGSATGALSATQALAQLQPDLLLVDATLPDEEVAALLQWTREHLPAAHCLVMTLTMRQRDQALAWGAHAAIQRASLASQLEVILNQLPLATLPPWNSMQSALVG
jgi:DNA-binding NarL/FixJ family response regulator